MPEEPRAGGPVLLVDDDTAFTDLVARQLEAHGFSVVTADTIDACRRLLATGLRPALLLLDINLPGESGWSLLREGSLAAAGSPPVVILSGTEIRPQRLREFGVAGYLPKPVPMALLTACVARYVSGPGAAASTESSEVLG
ncbi:MAG: response regulator [Candidatus Limnocylindrales bacterium]